MRKTRSWPIRIWYAWSGYGAITARRSSAAVRDSGKLDQVKIVCFDEEEETLRGVQEGHIAGTIVQQPFEFGYQSVKLLAALAKGDQSGVPASKQLIIPVKTITRAEVDTFWDALKTMTGKK